ncbi:MAG TPA: hypothetical protein VFW85_03285 [Gaiellaceae bacterium]|nr:hypothetical protein [Gaiellaceae bacterium]
MRLTVLLAAAGFVLLLATTASARGRSEHQVVTASFVLTPAHPSVSISRRFETTSVGIESLRLTLPRGMHAELLIRNPVEVATGQPPSKMLCVPFRLCRDVGRTALRFCHLAGSQTVCAYSTDGGASFTAGRFVLTVREVKPTRAYAAVRLRVVFARGV